MRQRESKLNFIFTQPLQREGKQNFGFYMLTSPEDSCLKKSF